MLAHRLGAERLAAEPDAVEQIITACAHLPLALAIAAARAQLTDFPLAALAADLGQAGRHLDVLDAGDLTTQLRTVFSWSYSALALRAAQLFQLLGLHPGPDISAPAAASLAGQPFRETRGLLTELARSNLITKHTSSRYSLHDLLRAYATDLAYTRDTNAERHAATDRILDHYLHTAHTAERVLNPTRDPITLAPPQVGITPESPTDDRQALEWFTAEALLRWARWRVVMPDEAGIGATSQSRAQAGSERTRSTLPPATMSSSAAVSGLTPKASTSCGVSVVVSSVSSLS